MLVLVLVAIIQFAFILAAQIGVTNAVREAARTGSITVPTTTETQAETTAGKVYSLLTNPDDGLLKRNVFAFSAANIVTSGPLHTWVCYREVLQSGAYSVFIKVDAGYRHPIFIPLLDALLDGIDGVVDGGLRIGASQEMRVENAPIAASPAISACYNP
jgi:hypothetical protein